MKTKSNVDKFLKKLLDTIKSIYSNQVTVILFGGRARGTSSDYGDFDIMVILDEVDDPLEEAIKIRKKIREKEYPLDLLILEKEDVEKPIVKKMLEPHIVLYDGLKIGEKIA